MVNGPTQYLIAIGYDREQTAARAEHMVEQAPEVELGADSMAVVVRDGDGRYGMRTTHHVPVAEIPVAATHGMFWSILFSALYFVPVLGMAAGPALARLIAGVRAAVADPGFEDDARDLVQPGTSALFLVADEATADAAIEALSPLGGVVLRSELSSADAATLGDAPH